MLPPALAGAIVVVGWLVVERFARRRETRLDLRSGVDSFASAVDEVRAAAIAFYGLPGNDPQAQSLATTIRGKIGALSDHLHIIKAAGLVIDADELLKRFRQSVTGGEFDSVVRQPLLSTSPAFVRMAGDAQTLTRAVQAAMLKFLLPARGYPDPELR